MTEVQQDFPNIQSNRYKILSVLGSGGSGIVYKAYDSLLDKTVAIKKLHRTATRAESIRFQREAKMAATLNHPNVLTILDFGLTERNEPYMVLNFIEGQSLASYLNSVDALKLDRALDIFIQIADGLSHAHNKHVVHRDVTPNNIMLIKDGANTIVQIVDFGLAKSTEDEQHLTKSGFGVGTPLYMSPEQIRGKNIDQRSDIYSFGCLMYTVLRGVPPFESDNILSLIDMHLNMEPPPLRVISSDRAKASRIEDLVARCIKKRPADRYQSIDDILGELAAITSPEEAVVEQLPKMRVQKEYYGIVLAAATLVGCVGSIVFNIVADGALKEVHVTPKGILEKSRESETGTQDGTLNDFVENTGTPRGRAKAETYKTSMHVISNDADLKKFATNHPNAQELDLKCGLGVTSEGLAALTNLPLKYLILKRVKSLDKTGLRHLGSLKNVQLIKLINIDSIEWEGFEQLRKIPTLSELAIIDCKVDEKAFETLSKFDRLTRFELKNCRDLKVMDLGLLCGLKRLNTLTISDTGDSIKGFDKIACLPISILDVSGSPLVPADLDKIASLKSLTEFTMDLPPERLTPAMFAAFRKRRPDVKFKEQNRFGARVLKYDLQWMIP